jgi:predicted nucleic acid-binding protein
VVLVDTSVWISLYRRRNSEVGEKMWRLVARNEAALCGQVWVEFVGGFRRTLERRGMVRGLRAFPFLPTERPAFERAAEILGRNPKLGAGDAIIAATAITARVPLFTLDGDFAAVSSEGLVLF